MNKNDKWGFGEQDSKISPWWNTKWKLTGTPIKIYNESLPIFSPHLGINILLVHHKVFTWWKPPHVHYKYPLISLPTHFLTNFTHIQQILILSLQHSISKPSTASQIKTLPPTNIA